MRPLRWWAESGPPGGDSVKVSENLGATSVAPVAPVDTSLPCVTYNELCGCQLVLRTSKSAGAGGDVQNFGGCQAPVAPVLTQALVCGWVAAGTLLPLVL